MKRETRKSARGPLERGNIVERVKGKQRRTVCLPRGLGQETAHLDGLGDPVREENVGRVGAVLVGDACGGKRASAVSHTWRYRYLRHRKSSPALTTREALGSGMCCTTAPPFFTISVSKSSFGRKSWFGLTLCWVWTSVELGKPSCVRARMSKAKSTTSVQTLSCLKRSILLGNCKMW